MNGPRRLGIRQPKAFAYTLPAKKSAILNEKGEVDFYNHGVILTRFWLEPPLFLQRRSEATLGIGVICLLKQ